MERELTDREGGTGENRWEPDFRELVEGLGDAVYTLDLEGRFTWGNEAGLRYLGYDRGDFDEFLGKHFLDLLTPASKTVAIEHFKKGLGGEDQPPFFEVQAYHRDGTVLDFEIRASDLHYHGELIGRQGVVRDISAIKELQQALGSANAQRMGLAEGDVEILEHLARGRTNREIAGLVHLSPHTIKDRVGRILRVLGAQSRAEATAIAIKQRLIVSEARSD